MTAIKYTKGTNRSWFIIPTELQDGVQNIIRKVKLKPAKPSLSDICIRFYPEHSREQVKTGKFEPDTVPLEPIYISVKLGRAERRLRAKLNVKRQK